MMDEKSEKKETLMGKLKSIASEVNLSEVEMPERKSKSAPANMMEYVREQSVVMIENKDLKEKLAVYDGAHPVKKIDPKLIKPSKWANRNEAAFATKEFEALKAEIEAAGGNIQPIKVRPIAKTDPQEYEIVFGHRRHRACLEIGLQAYAIIEDLSEADLFTQMDRENRQRADLSAYEQGVMYSKALDDGLFTSMRKMADVLGVDQSNISKAINLAKLPAQIVTAFASPLDLQFGWSAQLTEALEKNNAAVLEEAAKLAALPSKPKAKEVFSRLVAAGIAQEPEKQKEGKRVLNGKDGKGGSIEFDQKTKSFRVVLTGLGAGEMRKIETTLMKELLS
jgi:ParB family chromosome partitioning protein